ncbi:biotin--[acetyl-CoA-carboxylase] ligase [Aureimonas jatrophae]|uniref:biotin--[biotin carboxyl-carrier protein] ligase n=1 Tax=Aureimonas jatrophae TaxID=1166073 RepID=A0A1H0MBD0_9HYPH|nr:biotin--[acetyl-CoA-carboxylase] ligase [Aureimonas jatrophae]MBB3951144.1 BirA family biotin operon repressor/biotin-[acetyl-CoA-carboxylase] ligase [Aureimonas jatrophae]SDO77631.1 BirA family transcriptional regulator, biotin operon repressor / biotin-[acetyl-CoA-carboxylase] ligase [Aureimonas jatrophae]
MAVRRLSLDEVGSTNSVAMEAARSGDPGPLWVTAECQSAGRGRRGRQWVSERGNLYATLLLIDPAPVAALGNLPLVAALGIRDALASLPGLVSRDVEIKWPNDVLVRGAKAVGILLESERLSNGRQAVVIGCGVNVAYAPEGVPYEVTTLRACGVDASLDVVFEVLAAATAQALDIWDRGRHFAAIRERWLAHARGVGGPCRVNLPDGSTVDGRFRDLDAAGRLLLELPNGELRSFSAGDLFLLPGAPQGRDGSSR